VFHLLEVRLPKQQWRIEVQPGQPDCATCVMVGDVSINHFGEERCEATELFLGSTFRNEAHRRVLRGVKTYLVLTT
jgi:hypothetical protein